MKTPINQTLYGTETGDPIIGGAGNDILFGLGGDDFLWGDSGNDSIEGGSGSDQLFGGVGNDFLNGGSDDDYIHAGVGNDRVGGGDGNELMYGGDGHDNLKGGAGNDVIVGDEEYLTNAGGNDWIDAGEGDDLVYGGAGNDLVKGGAGNDVVLGDAGIDRLFGGAGNDAMDGGDGDDFLNGGIGSDELYGFGGDDEMHSGGAPLDPEGFDSMWGGDGDDAFFAEGGFVEIRPEAGNDTITGISTDAGDPYHYWDWVYVNYSTSTGDIVANFTSHDISGLQTGQVSDGLGGIDSLSGINAIRDGSGDDSFYFDESFKALNGGGSSWFGESSAYVYLSAGDDFVDFTGLTDSRILRWFSDGGVYVNMAEGYATDYNPPDDPEFTGIGYDTFLNASGLRGTRHDDWLIGDDNDNSFGGFGGNDTIDGGLGERDGIRFGNSTIGITVDLSSGQVLDGVLIDGLQGTDTVTGIEDVEGSDHGDNITGDSNENVLGGLFGADFLHGGDGADTLDGGGDADTLTGGSGDDTFVLSAIWANGDVIADFEGAGALGGDVLQFEVYGAAATLSNAGGDFWQIDWSEGTDTFQISGVTSLDTADYVFV
jgi:Ca2+-binding RTX toxin-like protein